jgi:hypothetical protein
LQKENMLTPKHHTLLCQYPENASYLAHGLIVLHQAEILTPAHQNLLCQYAGNAEVLAYGLVALHQAEILTPEHQNLLCQHVPNAQRLAYGLVNLHDARILTPETRNILLQHINHAEHIGDMFSTLARTALFNANNKALLLELLAHDHHCIRPLAFCLFMLRRNGRVTQQNYETLIQNREFIEEIRTALLSAHLSVTQPAFDKMIIDLHTRQAEEKRMLVTYAPAFFQQSTCACDLKVLGIVTDYQPQIRPLPAITAKPTP